MVRMGLCVCVGTTPKWISGFSSRLLTKRHQQIQVPSKKRPTHVAKSFLPLVLTQPYVMFSLRGWSLRGGVDRIFFRPLNSRGDDSKVKITGRGYCSLCSWASLVSQKVTDGTEEDRRKRNGVRVGFQLEDRRKKCPLSSVVTCQSRAKS